jgi:DinB superfamily
MSNESRQVEMTQEELLVSTALSSWKLIISRVDHAIAPLGEQELQRQVAPGRNRLFYLIGHLTATNDRMFPMLGLGERLHPELDNAFITNPDRSQPDSVSAADLKKAWAEVNTKLTAAFEALSPKEWLLKHSAVSDEDFAKEPLRNRLAVLMSRTNHVSFHVGQMVLAK